MHHSAMVGVFNVTLESWVFEQELRTRLAESPAAPAAAEAPQEPDDDLIAALGQESEKVEKLIALLQERGFDPTEILDEVGQSSRQL